MYKLDFFTQYGQFYLVNIAEVSEMDDLEFWSDKALKERLAVEKNTLGVAVENDFSIVKGELETLEAPNEDIDPQADHIVEGSLEITSGVMEIQDCPNSETILAVPLENGSYRVRIYSYNLNDPCNGIDDRNPNDHYRIEIWKETPSDRKVLKQWIRNY